MIDNDGGFTLEDNFVLESCDEANESPDENEYYKSVVDEEVPLSFDATKVSRNTVPIMTKFEFAKIIGVRAEQICRGAEISIATSKLNAIEIALEELSNYKINLMIRRKLPNGNTELWAVNELFYEHLINDR